MLICCEVEVKSPDYITVLDYFSKKKMNIFFCSARRKVRERRGGGGGGGGFEGTNSRLLFFAT